MKEIHSTKIGIQELAARSQIMYAKKSKDVVN